MDEQGNLYIEQQPGWVSSSDEEAINIFNKLIDDVNTLGEVKIDVTRSPVQSIFDMCKLLNKKGYKACPANVTEGLELKKYIYVRKRK